MTSDNPEMQEKVAELLLTKHVHEKKMRGISNADLALRLLNEATLRRNSRATTLLQDGVAKGKFGLKKNAAASQCWATLEGGTRAPEECFRLTQYVNQENRPTCRDVYHILQYEKMSEAYGVASAHRCSLLGSYAILSPGGPPSHEVEMRIAIYRRHNIELIITGDTMEEKFEAFRKGFNDTMSSAIKQQYGPDIDEKIDAEAKAEVAAHQGQQRH